MVEQKRSIIMLTPEAYKLVRLAQLREDGIRFDNSLPHHFFEKASSNEDCPHPWQWFVWTYPDGSVCGMPFPLCSDAEEWLLENNIPLCEVAPPDKVKVTYRLMVDTVIAFFPEIPWSLSKSTCMSYMHVGQHGEASKSLLTELETPPEDNEDLVALRKELEGIYDNCILVEIK